MLWAGDALADKDLDLLNAKNGPTEMHRQNPRFKEMCNPVKEIDVRFPIENRKGIEAISVLNAGETTLVRFALTNVSHMSYGEEQPRKITLRLWLHEEGELTVDDFAVRTTTSVADSTDPEAVKELTDLTYPGIEWNDWSMDRAMTIEGS